MILDELVQKIQLASGNKTRFIIGIDGFGGSGKSTIAAKLQVALRDAQVVCIDDFIIKVRLLEQSADKILFDRLRLEDQVLKPLSQGNAAGYQKLNWLEKQA